MIDFHFYAKLLIRRLPVMITLIMLSSMASYLVAKRLPTLYKTSATMLVESAQISDDLARSTVRVAASEQLGIIQRQLMTRANLIDIANKLQIFPNMRSMSPDEIVARMRAATRIQQSGGRNKATLMTISFEGNSPKKIAAVVNEYVTIVLQANTDFRTTRAEGTLSFFEQEVDNLSGRLDEQSEKIVLFKNENADALPENLEYRLSRQALLQERLARAERDLEGLNVQESSIRRVYESTGRIVASSENAQSPQQRRLLQLEGDLRDALTIYSDQNPRVQALKRQISTLRADVEAATAQPALVEEDDLPAVSPLDVSLSELSARREALKQEVVQIQTELGILENSIGRTPGNAIALDAMERDLRNVQNLYNAAVQRMSQAQIGERIELSSKGERITVLEPASEPNKPSSPNRQVIVAGGFGAGLLLAAGWFLLLELLNQSIRRPTDITAGLGITPLSSIPRIETSAHRNMRRLLQIITLVGAVAGVLGSVWAIDTYYMPIDQLLQRVINLIT